MKLPVPGIAEEEAHRGIWPTVTRVPWLGANPERGVGWSSHYGAEPSRLHG